MLELFIGKVEFAILISEFKLRRFCFTESFLEGIKVFKVINERGAVIIMTFVHRAIFTMFPKVKSMVAMRTPEFSFVSKTVM